MLHAAGKEIVVIEIKIDHTPMRIDREAGDVVAEVVSATIAAIF